MFNAMGDQSVSRFLAGSTNNWKLIRINKSLVSGERFHGLEFSLESTMIKHE